MRSLQKNLHLAIESNHDRLLTFHLQEWYRFSKCRGERMNILRTFWHGWKSAIVQQRTDILLLKKARRTLQLVRIRRSLRKWMNAIHLSFILHAYQLHRIVTYLEKSPYLCLPPTFVHQSDRLLLIQYWKLVSISIVYLQ